jgi:hypothetical protein
MAVATARVIPGVPIPWDLLGLVIRSDGDWIQTQTEALLRDLTRLRTETSTLHETLTDLATKVDHLLAAVTELVEDTRPLWDDSYTLCGNPSCAGDCRVCQEGEYDGEEEVVEKYCARRRR